MRKNKILALLASVALILGTSLPVQAATYANGDTAGSITVTANVESSYSISLPATLALTLQADGTYSNTYTVGVKANINNNEYVTVTPAASFTMTGTTDAGHTSTAAVTQAIQTWRNSVSDAETQSTVVGNAYTDQTGTITASFTAIDSYSGTLNFTFAKATDA